MRKVVNTCDKTTDLTLTQSIEIAYARHRKPNFKLPLKCLELQFTSNRTSVASVDPWSPSLSTAGGVLLFCLRLCPPPLLLLTQLKLRQCLYLDNHCAKLTSSKHCDGICSIDYPSLAVPRGDRSPSLVSHSLLSTIKKAQNVLLIQDPCSHIFISTIPLLLDHISIYWFILIL